MPNSSPLWLCLCCKECQVSLTSLHTCLHKSSPKPFRNFPVRWSHFSFPLQLIYGFLLPLSTLCVSLCLFPILLSAPPESITRASLRCLFTVSSRTIAAMQAPTNTCKITQVISYCRKSKHPAGFSKMALADDVLWQKVMKHLTLSFTLSRRLVLTGKIISFWQVQICGQHLSWHTSFERFLTTTLLSLQFNLTSPPWYPQTISFMLIYNAPILGGLSLFACIYVEEWGSPGPQYALVSLRRKSCPQR